MIIDQSILICQLSALNISTISIYNWDDIFNNLTSIFETADFHPKVYNFNHYFNNLFDISHSNNAITY